MRLVAHLHNAFVARQQGIHRAAQGIPPRNRHCADGRPQCLPQRRGQQSQLVPDARTPKISVVAAKQLIARIARQGHRDMLTRRLAHQVRGDLRRIGKRLVVHGRQLGNHCLRFNSRHKQLGMVSAQVLRYRLGVGRLVKPGFFKAHGKGLDRATPTLLCLLLHQRDDGRRINPARQEST